MKALTHSVRLNRCVSDAAVARRALSRAPRRVCSRRISINRRTRCRTRETAGFDDCGEARHQSSDRSDAVRRKSSFCNKLFALLQDTKISCNRQNVCFRPNTTTATETFMAKQRIISVPLSKWMTRNAPKWSAAPAKARRTRRAVRCARTCPHASGFSRIRGTTFSVTAYWIMQLRSCAASTFRARSYASSAATSAR